MTCSTSTSQACSSLESRKNDTMPAKQASMPSKQSTTGFDLYLVTRGTVVLDGAMVSINASMAFASSFCALPIHPVIGSESSCEDIHATLLPAGLMMYQLLPDFDIVAPFMLRYC